VLQHGSFSCSTIIGITIPNDEHPFQRGDTTNQIFYTRTVFLDILLTVIGLFAQKDFAICAVLKELRLMHSVE
jgi:hypothetical protein